MPSSRRPARRARSAPRGSRPSRASGPCPRRRCPGSALSRCSWAHPPRPGRGLSARGHRQAAQPLGDLRGRVRREGEPQRGVVRRPGEERRSRDERDVLRSAACSSSAASCPSGRRAQTNMPPSGSFQLDRPGARRPARQERVAARAVDSRSRARCASMPPAASTVAAAIWSIVEVCRSPACFAMVSARRSAAGARSQPIRSPGARPSTARRRDRAVSAPGSCPARQRLAVVAQLAVGVVLEQPEPELAGQAAPALHGPRGDRAPRRVLEGRHDVEQLGPVLGHERRDRVEVGAVVARRAPGTSVAPASAKLCSAAR
jgi:hypothetical protein